MDEKFWTPFWTAIAKHGRMMQYIRYIDWNFDVWCKIWTVFLDVCCHRPLILMDISLYLTSDQLRHNNPIVANVFTDVETDRNTNITVTFISTCQFNRFTSNLEPRKIIKFPIQNFMTIMDGKK